MGMENRNKWITAGLNVCKAWDCSMLNSGMKFENLGYNEVN